MKRAEFLSRLRAGLAGLPPHDIDELVSDYDAHFSEGLAAGRSEEELTVALGDPARLARELRAEAGFRKWEERRSPGNFFGALFALIGLAAFNLILLLPLLIVVGVVLFVIAAACFAVLIAGFAVVGDTFLDWPMPALEIVARTFISVGLISGSIGVGAALIVVMQMLLNALARYARLHYRLLNSDPTSR